MDIITKRELEYCLRLYELRSGIFSKKSYLISEIRRHIESKSITHGSLDFVEEMRKRGCVESYEIIGKRTKYIVNITRLRQFIKEVLFVGDKTAFETAKKIIELSGGTITY